MSGFLNPERAAQLDHDRRQLARARGRAAAEIRAGGTAAVRELIASWQESRRALRAIEEAEHPDVTDVFGRVWVWWSKDLYTHDGMAWPLDHITSGNMSLPTKQALENPNYRWCSTCMGEAS